MAYPEIEAAVVSRFISYFPQLSDTRCKAGDLDAVLNAMFDEGATVGCVLEYGGGYEDTGKPYSKQVFIWTIRGIFLIRYSDTIEQDLRTLIGTLPGTLRPDATLGGVTPLAKFTRVEEADTVEINDIPFYWVGFQIEVIER